MTFTDSLDQFIPILDEKGLRIGAETKLHVHQKALYHEAFSVFVFNEKKELLLQKRASHKYHSPDLWTNTVCSHPHVGEENAHGAKRRLAEEMGLILDVHFVETFSYESPVLNHGLIENELDYLYTATWHEESLDIDTEEVAEVRWLSQDELEKELEHTPEIFTYWLWALHKSGVLKRLFL